MTTFEEQLKINQLKREEEAAEAPKKKRVAGITTLPEGARVLGTKEEILNAPDAEHEYIPVPEWGGEGAFVKILNMSGQQRDAFEDSVVNKGKKGKDGTKEMNVYNVRAKICALHIVDEDNNHLFSWEDIEALGQKSAKPLERIADRAQLLSGITNDDVEELVKNSMPTASATS